MIRIMKLSSKYYGIEFDLDESNHIDEIKEFVDQGDPILIVNDLEDVENFGIYENVEMVERTDD